MSNPEVAELLSSKNVLGCKRLCVDTGYWAKYNRSNVTFIEVSREPIEAITPTGFHVRDREYAVDAIVLATGFDAITGALLKIDIRGTGGRALEEKRCEGPKTYLGLGIAGFPNLFTSTGPGSPSSMLQSIEQHVEWVVDCIGYLRDRSRIEARARGPKRAGWRMSANWPVAHCARLQLLVYRRQCAG